MSDVEWTNELVVRLMREYRKRPELWDGAHDLYRVHTAKYEAWAELAGLFECDIVDLRKKLNSIFASHRREKAKVRCGGRSTWFLYPHMSFLPTHVENDETTAASERRRRILQLPEAAEEPARCSAAEEEETEAEACGVVVKSEAGVGLPKVRRGVRYAAGRPPRPPRRARLAKRRVAKEKRDEDDRSRLAEMMRLLRRSDSFKKKDECDSFGEYIADSLRKHDERTQSMIKQAINNILFEQEMKRCGGGHYAAAAAAAAAAAGGGNPLAAPDLA